MALISVLNIDDDQDDRSIFCEAVAEISSEIDCITKSSGEEALEYLKSAQKLPAVIFLDINMPLMSGKACLAELKKNTKLSAIDVVVLSTTINPKEIIELKKLGAEFLHKESNYHKYVEAIRSKLVRLSSVKSI
jgi:DNA-binding NarL/FixJ family response regulator